jgi:hypothetical protein
MINTLVCFLRNYEKCAPDFVPVVFQLFFKIDLKSMRIDRVKMVR